VSKNNIKACRSGADLIRYGLSHGCTVKRQCGSHVTLAGPKGQFLRPIPRHPGDLGKGLRMLLIKAFAAIDIVVLLIAWGVYSGVIHL
jgi:hypothetical protein